MKTNSRIILTVLALAACSGPQAEQRAPTANTLGRPVRIATVVESTMTRPVSGTGTLGARDELVLGFKIGGVIARVAVDPGDRVRQGQVLATLEHREIDAQVAKAQSAAEKAERDVARLNRLYQDSVVTLAQLQDATTALDVAHADLDAASFNQRYATIVAPVSGTVLRRMANAGEQVAAGTPLLSIASLARGAVVRVGLVDRDVVRVKVGDSAAVRFDAYPNRTFRGTVREIGASATHGTGTFPVEVLIAGAESLPNGLVGQVEIRPRDAETVRLVPIEALVEADGDRGTVYVLRPDQRHVERREVDIAFTDGARVALAGGLDHAQSVVTDGAAYLEDGDSVRVAP
jgi:RND family efflux transporter MFP subunit